MRSFLQMQSVGERRWVLCTLAACVAAPAGAQLTGTNKPNGDETATIVGRGARLIVEPVVVKDKAGKSVEGLTAKDFTITEDGVAQKISFCEYQKLPEDATPLPPQTTGQEDIKIYNRLAHTQIAAETTGEIKYKDHRLLALYFDMTAMPPPTSCAR